MPEKKKSTKRRKASTSITMSPALYEWVKTKAESHGMTISGYIEFVLRDERKRQETAPEPVKLVTIDPHTGNVVPFRFGDIRNA